MAAKKNEVGFEEMRRGFIRVQAKYQKGEPLTDEEVKSTLAITLNTRFDAMSALAAEESRANTVDPRDGKAVDIRYGESFKSVMAGLGINHRCAFEAMKKLGWMTGDKRERQWTIAGCKKAYGNTRNIHVEENPALFRFEDGKCYVDTLSNRYAGFIKAILDKTKELFGDARYNDPLRKKCTVLGYRNQIFIHENREELGYFLYAKSGNRIKSADEIQYSREY